MTDITEWREPTTKAFSCVKHPGDKSCDNGVLFTMEAAALGLISVHEAESIANRYEYFNGCFLRYPGSNDFMSWDDHLGAASVSPVWASKILDYMQRNDWIMPDGAYLGRFPVFEPAIRAGAGLKLSVWSQIKASAAYLWNCFEGKKHTSGKLLLWLASSNLSQHQISGVAIWIWKFVMKKKYPNGLKGVMSIYFPEGHPFIEAASEEWS